MVIYVLEAFDFTSSWHYSKRSFWSAFVLVHPQCHQGTCLRRTPPNISKRLLASSNSPHSAWSWRVHRPHLSQKRSIPASSLNLKRHKETKALFPHLWNIRHLSSQSLAHTTLYLVSLEPAGQTSTEMLQQWEWDLLKGCFNWVIHNYIDNHS